jgi:hypothetical protein
MTRRTDVEEDLALAKHQKDLIVALAGAVHNPVCIDHSLVRKQGDAIVRLNIML